MTIVIISHDIALLKEKADYIFVFDKGEIVEKWNPKNKNVPNIPKSEIIPLKTEYIFVTDGPIEIKSI